MFTLRRFDTREPRGQTLVEFAMVLPMMLLVFAVIMEGSRLFWGYQATISGVRDATRYRARVAPADICVSGGTLDEYTAKLEAIVEETVDGELFYPIGITVDSVTPGLACVPGTYRNNPVPIATVTAEITVTFPFSGIFTLVNGTLPDVTTAVADSSRIYGA